MVERIRDIRMLKVTHLSKRTTDAIAEDANWKAVCILVDARDLYHCRVCGRKVVRTMTVQVNRLERHHVIPISRGGPDSVENVATACLGCHKERHTVGTLAIDGNAEVTLRCERNGLVWWSPNPQLLLDRAKL